MENGRGFRGRGGRGRTTMAAISRGGGSSESAAASRPGWRQKGAGGEGLPAVDADLARWQLVGVDEVEERPEHVGVPAVDADRGGGRHLAALALLRHWLGPRSEDRGIDGGLRSPPPPPNPIAETTSPIRSGGRGGGGGEERKERLGFMSLSFKSPRPSASSGHRRRSRGGHPLLSIYPTFSNVYDSEPTFQKGADGQARLAGSILSSIESGNSISHERTINKGMRKEEIRQIVSSLRVSGGDTIISSAKLLYELAVDKKFTRGRPTTHVAAACLYIACRRSKKAYLLIDFSRPFADKCLCQVLLLTEHPFIHNLVDPSFFIYRFTFYRTVPVVKSSPKSGEVPCKHKEDGGAEHFAHGLCEECYNEFIKLSGGLEGGSDLQLSNELKKQRLEAAEKATEDAATKEAALQSSCETHNSVVENNITTPTKILKILEGKVDGYLHNEQETQFKKVIWEEMNKEYLERRRHNEYAKNSTPAQTPAEATQNMLKRKRLGSKINDKAVNKMYNDTGDGETFEGGSDYPDHYYDGYGDGVHDDYDVDF
uniref:Cyclin-like domain-containing protein n=1 Tax=Oryza punctata TaxID=4537 RepID=A0A0E0KNL8_ORYPU